MDISVFINAFNEEKNLRELLPTLREFDDIVVIDHRSTDHTAAVARDLGARVETRPVICDIVTQKDVDMYTKRIGFRPHFVVGEAIQNWAADFTASMPLLSHDWVLWIDCDERLTWNRAKVEREMAKADIIACPFINGRNSDGTPKNMFLTKKLFKKSKHFFVCQTHTIVMGYDSKEAATQDMTIEHFQEGRPYRDSYLKTLEYGFLKEKSTRMNYYLARAYFHSMQFNHALKLFSIYDKTPSPPDERCKAYTMMSGCLWELGRYEESYAMLFKAMRTYPFLRLPFDMMANLTDLTNKEYAALWRQFASLIPRAELA